MGVFSESVEQLAYLICKDGFGEALRINAADISHSAAYNRVSSAASKIINTMDPEDAKKIRNAISKGSDEFLKDADFQTAIHKMSQSDNEATSKAANEFLKLSKKYGEAVDHVIDNPGDAVEKYAEFLGRKDGKMGLLDTLSGYFDDKTHGSIRKKAGIGALVGTGVATRLLSGGSLTRTSTGERDIAGIPFI